MKDIYEQFFTIVGNFTGDSSTPLESISEQNWQKLFDISVQQKLECAVFESVYNVPAFETAKDTLKHEWKALVKKRYIFEVRKTERFWSIYEKLLRDGIHPLILKGVVCRFLYTKPYARPSGDEDLLVKAEELEACIQTLEKTGLQKVSDSEGNVLKYMDLESGLQIEVHRSLFGDDGSIESSFNEWFKDAFVSREEIMIEGHRVYTMQPTLHLLYLITHWIKHFVGPGVGVRQICDISKFVNKWGDRINWSPIVDRIESKGYMILCANILEIGMRYFHMERQKVGFSEVFLRDADPETLMDDLMKAGIYGSSSVSRLHSSTLTLDAIGGHRGKLRILFPPAKGIEKRYPYLKKCPFLLPVAWVSRLTSYVFEIFKNRRGNNSPGESIAIGAERLRLLKKYGLIK